MTLDIDALRVKLDSFKGQEQRTSAFWKPKPGKQIIRIVPLKGCPENPFIEQYFHYLGGRTHLSPITNQNRDPIVEFANSIRSEGTREAYQQSKEFMPKLRTSVPVVVRGEEDRGVRFWSFGKTVYEQLLTYIADPDYGDITDVETGRDITVEYIPQEKSDTNFPKTNLLVKPNTTPLSEDETLANTWLTTQPDLSAISKEPSYDELKTFLERYLNPDGDHGDSEQNSITESITSPTVSVPTADASSIGDEFDSLFGES